LIQLLINTIKALTHLEVRQAADKLSQLVAEAEAEVAEVAEAEVAIRWRMLAECRISKISQQTSVQLRSKIAILT
jgi:hypothetical protein